MKGSAPAGAAEMGVAEAGRIFEAEAERAVEADMRDPDQPAGRRDGTPAKNPASASTRAKA